MIADSEPSRWFGHSGDLGDIIYALPTIRRAGGGTLILYPAPGKTMHLMTASKAELLRPLLVFQSYVDAVVYVDEHEDHNLNGFRHHWQPDRNLADMHLGTHGYNYWPRCHKWLEVDYQIRDHKVVFARTKRYRNDNFPWTRVWAKYKDDAVFVGLPDEHEAFCREIGPVPHAVTKDFLELARIIAGADLFVGNQTAASAVAEGLKVNMILEVCRSCPNCAFERTGRINAWGDNFELPDIQTEVGDKLQYDPQHGFFSQHGEDEWIVQHLTLPARGVFVEVGAADGVVGSNTYYFEQRGWTGLLIEPDMRQHDVIRQNRRARIDNCAVGTNTEATFYLDDYSPYSGLLRTNGQPATTVQVKLLGEILDNHGITSIDLLSIDTEGSELDVWASFDPERFKPKVLIIEWDTAGLPDRSEEIADSILKGPYQMVHKTAGNLIFVRCSSTWRL